MSPPLLIMSGPPGGGKGTVCERVLKDTRLVHLSTGDLLREEIARGTEIGEEVQRLMRTGQLVGEELIGSMVLKQLDSAAVRERGCVLDGFPRTELQARLLSEYCRNSTWRVDAFVVVDVPDHVLLDRAAGRRLDPETNHIYHLKYKPPPPEIAHRLKIRPDDRPDRQKLRISIFRENTLAIEQCFPGVVVHVNGNQSMDAVYDEFCRKAVPLVYGKRTPPPKYAAYASSSKL